MTRRMLGGVADDQDPAGEGTQARSIPTRKFWFHDFRNCFILERVAGRIGLGKSAGRRRGVDTGLDGARVRGEEGAQGCH